MASRNVLFVTGWLLALSVMVSRLVCIVAGVGTPFLFTAESCRPLRLDRGLFTHSSVDELLGCLHFGRIVNKAAVNIQVQVLV